MQSHFPLVRTEQDDIRAGRGCLVTVTRGTGFLPEGLNLEWLEFLVGHLTLGMEPMLGPGCYID